MKRETVYKHDCIKRLICDFLLFHASAEGARGYYSTGSVEVSGAKKSRDDGVQQDLVKSFVIKMART